MQRLSDFQFKAEPAEFCPVCGKPSKMMITRPSKFGGSTQTVVSAACDCKAAEIEAERQKGVYASRQVRERNRYMRAFGNRETVGSFEGDDGRNQRLMEACRRYAGRFDEVRLMKTNGILMTGPTRRGKTFAAEAVAMWLHNQGKSVLMDTMAGFVQRIQSAKGVERDALMMRIAKCDLLVVDDYGASRDTSFGREASFSVIDTRVSAKGPMIVTTNLTCGQMADDCLADARETYRIMERCFPIAVESEKGIADNADHGAIAGVIFG